jgi:hypothetical protein
LMDWPFSCQQAADKRFDYVVGRDSVCLARRSDLDCAVWLTGKAAFLTCRLRGSDSGRSSASRDKVAGGGVWAGRLSFVGHTLRENRNGLIVDCRLTSASTGTSGPRPSIMSRMIRMGHEWRAFRRHLERRAFN